MLREQKIMERIVNEIGEELNEYIKTFYVCDFWKIKEGELIVNKTFKRLLDILADYNLTTTDIILSNAFKLIESNEVMMIILDHLSSDYVRNGGESLLNRAMVFCYCLYMMTEGKWSATEILNRVIDSEVLQPKYTFWHTLKYKLKLVRHPYKVKGHPQALLLITVLRGMPMNNVITDIGQYKDLI